MDVLPLWVISGHFAMSEQCHIAGAARIAQAKARMAADFSGTHQVLPRSPRAGESFILGLPGAVPAAGGVSGATAIAGPSICGSRCRSPRALR